MTHTTQSPVHFDVIVIGAGHAGCEAALASARIGARVLVVTPNLDRVGFMPCNPSIGGPGKSHLVTEVDALGGAMAEVADAAAVQVRRLNTSKGPAVQAIRHQVDKSIYAMLMKQRLEEQPGILLVQDNAEELTVESGQIRSVCLRSRGRVGCSSVVVTAGTFLRAAMIAGEGKTLGGRSGDPADVHLAESIAASGLGTRRFKTGTPPRIDGRTVDFTQLEQQPGELSPAWLSRSGQLGEIEPFVMTPSSIHKKSWAPDGWRPQLSCFRTSTNPLIHDLIRGNLDRAPMFNGMIEGAGPRYCPSIEDKVDRYQDKAQHPVFLEPEGWRTNELYVQGMSTSLPFDVQRDALRLIPGLESVEITRYGYAVEYDAVDPNDLLPTLEARSIRGLFLAGQVNGTSGYEEAAAQGLIAGLNAARHSAGQDAVRIGREQGYIGVLIDDLVSLPFTEPYRMLTARAEYRLSFRPDTAHDRFAALASEWGLISSDRSLAISLEQRTLATAHSEFGTRMIAPQSGNALAIESEGETRISKAMSLADLMRRPSMSLDRLRASLPEVVEPVLRTIPVHLVQRFEDDLKYAAFITREQREVDRAATLSNHHLPSTADGKVPGLRNEARQQIEHHRPSTFSDARKLPGVTAADISALLVHSLRLEHHQK